VQGIPQLPEVVVKVTDFVGHYGGDWRRVKEEVNGINRMGEDDNVATARVHVVVSDRAVRNIGVEAFLLCRNLVKVMAPFVEEVGKGTFRAASNIRHVTLSPIIVVHPGGFVLCYSLEVLAVSVGFELDTGDRWGTVYWNNPTAGITKFAKWRNQMEDKKE